MRAFVYHEDMRLTLAVLLTAGLLPAALTPEQKAADLHQLAGLFAQHYGPYEWKRDTKGFDLFHLQPWLERARRTENDIEFMELLSEWVSSLDDAHVNLSFPSTFSARLGFSVDIFEGKVLIDSVARGLLPLARYPFEVGDEIVSLDGTPIAEWIPRFRKYGMGANPSTTNRLAANRIFNRSQSTMPSAHLTGSSATVVVRRASGAEESYEIPWVKAGDPFTEAGRNLQPRSTATSDLRTEFELEDDTLPLWSRPLQAKMIAKVPHTPNAVLNYGGLAPIFALPPAFVQRVGRAANDPFYTGTFQSDGLRLGFLRLPRMSPAIGITAALNLLQTEIAFLEANTDGLIIDVMRNPGGSVGYVEGVARLLHPAEFRTLGFQIRATNFWVASFSSQLSFARVFAPSYIARRSEANYAAVKQANSELRGRTGAIPLNGEQTLDLQPATDAAGRPAAYTKPILVLTDEFSASGGDMLPAVLQDNGRALIYGTRTMGAGGNVVGYDATSYTDGYVSITESLMERKNNVVAPGFPASPFVENVGVQPDVVDDYMTRDNLMNRGTAFVTRFTQAAVQHIRRSAPR